MTKINTVCDIDDCYGCFACIDVCPSNAISVVSNEKGYLYPSIDGNICINCSACINVCPQKSIGKLNLPLNVQVGKTMDEEDYLKSSSGGAFKSIIRACVDKYKSEDNLYVAGCVWDEMFHSKHDIVQIESVDDVDVFSKSKYVQSNTMGIYGKLKQVIDSSRNFLIFSGTPCQCSALKNYLGKEYDNLLLIDLLCHGVESQMLFDKYVEGLEKNNNSKLSAYEFRTKDVLENGTKYTRSCKYTFENGVTRRLSRKEDGFLISYYEEKERRQSCKKCSYHQLKRCGDISIGDAWGINQAIEDLNPLEGVSLILYNTPKGLTIASEARRYMYTYEATQWLNNRGGV